MVQIFILDRKSLPNRLATHRYDSRRRNSKLYKKMQEVGEKNWEMVPLFTQKCDLQTTRKVEQDYINRLKPDLNERYAFGSRPGYSKEKISKYDREYRKKNWTKIREFRNKKVVCEVCLTTHNHEVTARHKKSKYHGRIEKVLFELD